jgi:hypothetical protein
MTTRLKEEHFVVWRRFLAIGRLFVRLAGRARTGKMGREKRMEALIWIWIIVAPAVWFVAMSRDQLTGSAAARTRR